VVLEKIAEESTSVKTNHPSRYAERARMSYGTA
jgi:hypothetical protein